MRESSGVEDGVDTGVDATGEAAERRGGLDDDARTGGGTSISGCESGGDGGHGAEFDVRELPGAVADDLVLHLSNGFDFRFAVG